jgi:hypothetical protein
MGDSSSSELSDNEYYVEKVLDKKIEGGEVRYLIKWEGWAVENSTWEPLDNLGNIQNLLEKFERESREGRKKLGRPSKNEKEKATVGASATKNVKRKDDTKEKKKLDEDEERSEKNEMNVINELEFNIPEEVLSVKRDKEGQILCMVKFKERSDGISPENAYVPSSVLRDLHPKILIKYYESKIKFVEKK